MARFPENDIISLIGPTPRYDLGESTGPDLRLAELLDGAEIGDLPIGYGTAAGNPTLRAAIARANGADPADVVVTVGGMHALFLLAFILCDAGNEAVIAMPCFPLARNALEAVGTRVRILPLSFDSGYRLDRTDLRAVLSPKTKLVSVASPQNPSGVAIQAETIRDILDLMARVCPEAKLLVDETYREAAYANNPTAQSAVALGPNVISIASLSKCHGAPGLRLGWAIIRDPELRRQVVTGKFNTVISCSPVDEMLALRLLERSAPIIATRRAHLDDGLRRTASWVQANHGLIEWVRPDAGAICCVRLKPDVFDDAAVARFYESVAEKGARVANGAWFGDDVRVFRLGFGLLPMPEFDAALAAITVALEGTARAAGRVSVEYGRIRS